MVKCIVRQSMSRWAAQKPFLGRPSSLTHWPQRMTSFRGKKKWLNTPVSGMVLETDSCLPELWKWHLLWKRTRIRVHSTQGWNENHRLLSRPLEGSPLLPPAEGKLASGTEGFLAMSQVGKQLVSQGQSGILVYTRVNIECEMLLISRTKAISINERCPFAVGSNHFLGPGSLAMAQCCCESCMTLSS